MFALGLTPPGEPVTPETMQLDDLVKFAESLGAPTVVAILIIMRIERRMDELTKTLAGMPGIFAEIMARHLVDHQHPGPKK